MLFYSLTFRKALFIYQNANEISLHILAPPAIRKQQSPEVVDLRGFYVPTGTNKYTCGQNTHMHEIMKTKKPRKRRKKKKLRGCYFLRRKIR